MCKVQVEEVEGSGRVTASTLDANHPLSARGLFDTSILDPDHHHHQQYPLEPPSQPPISPTSTSSAASMRGQALRPILSGRNFSFRDGEASTSAAEVEVLDPDLLSFLNAPDDESISKREAAVSQWGCGVGVGVEDGVGVKVGARVVVVTVVFDSIGKIIIIPTVLHPHPLSSPTSIPIPIPNPIPVPISTATAIAHPAPTVE